MVYFIQLSLLMLFLVNCASDDFNIPSHIRNIEIPYFSKEAEKCNSGSEFEKYPRSNRTLLEQCHDVESRHFQECKNKAREACQKVTQCSKNEFLEVIFYDQNELKERLQTAETETDILTITSEVLFDQKGGPSTKSRSQCTTSQTVEFQSFITTHRVKEEPAGE